MSPIQKSVIFDPTWFFSVQNLPFELQERIREELMSIKITQRSALSWDKIHQELQETPFCQERQSLVKVWLCFECTRCEIDGLCKASSKEGFYHKAFPDINEYNCARRYIKLSDCDQHAWMKCTLRGLNPYIELDIA